MISTIDSSGHWRRDMQGSTPSNRLGTEPGRNGAGITFYGSSFIADSTGAKITEANRTEEAILTATFDLDAIEARCQVWACSATAGRYFMGRC